MLALAFSRYYNHFLSELICNCGEEFCTNSFHKASSPAFCFDGISPLSGAGFFFHTILVHSNCGHSPYSPPRRGAKEERGGMGLFACIWHRIIIFNSFPPSIKEGPLLYFLLFSGLGARLHAGSDKPYPLDPMVSTQLFSAREKRGERRSS